MSGDCIVLKCETQKSFNEISKKSNIWELLLSVATTYSYKENRYRIWSFSKKDDLIKYLKCKCVITFNGLRFDFPLLFGEDFKLEPDFYRGSSTKYDIEFYCVDLFAKIMRCVYRQDNYDALIDKMRKNPLANLQAYSLLQIHNCTIPNKKVEKEVFNYDSIGLFKTRKVLELVDFNLLKLNMIKNLFDYVYEYKQIINGDYDVVYIGNIEKNPDDFIPF